MGGYERTVFVLITAHVLCQKIDLGQEKKVLAHGELMGELMGGRFSPTIFVFLRLFSSAW